MATQPILCPSAGTDVPDAQVFAVVVGTPEQPRAAYLDRPVPVTPQLRAAVHPAHPAEVLRAAAPCAKADCGHFDDGAQRCRLVAKTVGLAPIVVRRLPRCAIRMQCRWWTQEGAAACQRCPQVATLHPAASTALRAAADPNHLTYQELPQ